jgi:membrane protease YdiL (CAAX protease family)
MAFETSDQAADADRFVRLEDQDKDFPFYNGTPSRISAGQWLFVLAMVVVAFLLLALPIDWPGGAFGPFIPAILFPTLPLAALAWVAPGHWRSIFGRIGGREVKLMFGFALLNIVVSFGVGAALSAFAEVTPNAAIAQLSALDAAGQAAFLAKTVPQLFGEEVLTILPFLAMLQWLVAGLGVGRQRAIIVAWLLSSLLFGLLHLPTYDWNVVQCVLVIGVARLVLILPWIMTKNIWVSTGAHIINDWSLFGLALLGAGLAAGP